MDFKTLAVAVTWLIFIVIFVRALWKGNLLRSSNRRIWRMAFFSILAFSFWGEPAEAFVDRHFGGLPIALYLKYVCLIWVCHLYLQMLKDIGSIPKGRRYSDCIAPGAISVGLISFIIYALVAPISLAGLRFLVIGARDATVLIYIVFCGFISGAWAVFQRETVPTMRFKFAANLLFFVCIAVSSVGSISTFIIYIFQLGDPWLPERMLRPFIFLGVFFFALMLIPYAWYARLLYFQRLYIYYRLRHLERVSARLVGTEPYHHRNQGSMSRSDNLELAIYRTVISILDCYPAIHELDGSGELFADIHYRVQKHSDYPDLVRALARIRP